MGIISEALEQAEKDKNKAVVFRQKKPDEPYAVQLTENIEYPLVPWGEGKPFTVAQRYTDQYENIKSNLFSRYPKEQLRTIVFTSPSNREGTSTTAVNFASALARDSWRSVLLIDADVRRPCLHKLFNISLSNGLSDILSKEEEFEHEPNKIRSNFYIHTSGLFGTRAVGLFDSDKFNAFLELAKQRFDNVILDCPPVFNYPETRIIARKVNGVVLVIGARSTRKRVALRAKKDLEETGSHLLGVVLNKRRYYIPTWIYKRL